MATRQQQGTLTGAEQPRSIDRQYLNESVIIYRVIRNFTREVLGLVGRENFMTRLDFECRRMNGLVLGAPASTDRYKRNQPNTPGQLGEYVLKALQVSGETRLSVRDVFTSYFSRVLDLVGNDRRFEAAVLEPLLADLRGALTGQFAQRQRGIDRLPMPSLTTPAHGAF